MATHRAATGRHVLGFDFGTSALKAALFDENGARVAGHQVPYPLEFPSPGWAQQEPGHWWNAMGEASRALMASSGVAPADVAAIGLAAQMCGCIPTDDSGEALHPCLIWLDTRSQAQAHALTAGGPRVSGYGAFTLAHWLWLSHGAPNLAGKDPPSKMVWLSEQPQLAGRIARFVDVRDWLVWRCTGVCTTAEDAAQLTWMMDTRSGRREWSPALMRRVGVRREQLPDIVPSCQPAGVLTDAAARHLGLAPGTVVASGSGDMNAYALAAGGEPDGGWHLHVGTSAWLGTQCPRRRVDPFSGIATICSALPDRHLLVATQDSAGSSVAWAARVLGFGDDAVGLTEFDAAASRAQPGKGTPMFLPWLHGERVPVDDAAVRGGFAGVALDTSRDELALAALVGVALNARWAFDHARRLVPDVRGPLRMLGGGARSKPWPQIFADMLGHPVAVVAEAAWGGSRGAAIMAQAAAGLIDDPRQGMAQARIERTCEPDARMAGWAADQYGQFVEHYRANRRWHRRRRAWQQRTPT